MLFRSLLTEKEIGLVSAVYTVFEVVSDKLIPEYLMLWFKRSEFDRYARYHSHGSVREIFDWEEMCNVELPVPPIEEQKAIVKAYETIERRIELKRKINDNLEAQAGAIYNTLISENVSNEEENIYNILSVINGSPFSSDYFNSEKNGYPLVRIRDLSKCDPEVYTDEVLKTTEYVNVGDILIGMDGEFIPHIWFGKTGVLNQRVCKVIPSQNYIHPLFLYFTLKPILTEIQRTQGGTTVIHIGKKDFDKMSCVSLSEDKRRFFYEKVSPLFSQILNNDKEILKLTYAHALVLATLSR